MTDEERQLYHSMLQWALREAVRHDTEHDARYQDVLNAIAGAHRLGYRAGFRIDPQEPEWPVAYIELPTGQVSWHMPQHPEPWDGHTAEEKVRRIERFVGETVTV